MLSDYANRSLVRALLLMPFIVPTVLSSVAWTGSLDPVFPRPVSPLAP